MNDITTRFLTAYEYLLENKRIKNTRDFGIKLKVSNSLVTELCKARSNAGIVPVQNLLLYFDEINAKWLLTGQGDMINDPNNINILDIENEILELKEKILYYKDKADFFEGKNQKEVNKMAVQVEKIYQMLMRSKVDKLIELGEKEIAEELEQKSLVDKAKNEN
ncbi:hypothetical protein [Flavobacterium sp.]|uniref:hypothetical protein n=1 Tax=Flavobacterium sp. TaxID=239 RepID=UPI00375211BA